MDISGKLCINPVVVSGDKSFKVGDEARHKAYRSQS
jgi:hypothetical protein